MEWYRDFWDLKFTIKLLILWVTPEELLLSWSRVRGSSWGLPWYFTPLSYFASMIWALESWLTHWNSGWKLGAKMYRQQSKKKGPCSGDVIYWVSLIALAATCLVTIVALQKARKEAHHLSWRLEESGKLSKFVFFVQCDTDGSMWLVLGSKYEWMNEWMNEWLDELWEGPSWQHGSWRESTFLSLFWDDGTLWKSYIDSNRICNPSLFGFA